MARDLQRCRGARSAFTLIELAVVLAILAVLFAVGWGTLHDQLPRYQMIRAAKSLAADVRELRGVALATDRETRLVLTGSPGDCSDRSMVGGSYELQAGNRGRGSTRWEYLPADPLDSEGPDDDSRGHVDLGKTGSRRVCLASWPSIGGPGGGNRDAVVFSPRGWVANPGEDFAAVGAIELTLVNQGAEPGVDDVAVVSIARTGQVHLRTSRQPGRGPVGTAASSSAP